MSNLDVGLYFCPNPVKMLNDGAIYSASQISMLVRNNSRLVSDSVINVLHSAIKYTRWGMKTNCVPVNLLRQGIGFQT